MNPLWLMSLIPSRIVFEQRNCPRCGETHDLVQRLSRTRFRCRKCSAPLTARKRANKAKTTATGVIQEAVEAPQI